MSAIPCASVSLKTMADGTLRISFDIEPMHAQDAFRLFAAPGTPAALAALQVGYAAAASGDVHAMLAKDPGDVTEAGIPVSEKPKIGPLAYWLVLRCNEPEFWGWLNSYGQRVKNSTDAANEVKSRLSIASRKEIDGNGLNESNFHKYIRGPYSKYLAARGITA